MNKISVKKLIILFGALACYVLSPARDIYVSPSGASSGEGADISNPVNWARMGALINSITDADVTVYLTQGTYYLTSSSGVQFNNSIKRLKLTKAGAGEAIIKGTNGTNKYGMVLKTSDSGTETARRSVTFSNITLDSINGDCDYGLIISLYSKKYFDVTYDNVRISNSTNTNGNDRAAIITVAGEYNTVTVRNTTIVGCLARHLLAANSHPHKFEMYRVSVYNSTAKDYMMRLYNDQSGAMALIYDCTFSNITFTNSDKKYHNIYCASSNNIRFINNTMYHAGGIYISSGKTVNLIANNIIIEDRANVVQYIISGDGTWQCMENNILGTTTNLQWSKVDKQQTQVLNYSDLSAMFDTTRTDFGSNLANGRMVHDVTLDWDQFKGRASRSYGLGFTEDQIGRKFDVNFNSIGAVAPDNIRMEDIPNNGQVFTEPSELETRTIDLSEYIHYLPVGVSEGDLTYQLTGATSSQVGSVSLNGSVLTYTPAQTGVEGSLTIAFKVSKGDYSDTGEATFIIQKYNPSAVANAPGYLDASTFESCFEEMGAVDFTSQYRFLSGYTGTAPTSWQGGQINDPDGDKDRLSHFMIPLVADLNHDGYPEIVCIGRKTGTSGVGEALHKNVYNRIFVFNGQTGKIIAEHLLRDKNGNAISFHVGGYHSAPSGMALVDADRDGIVECIIAVPGDGAEGTADSNSDKYRNKLISYKLTPNGSSYNLEYNWESAAKYADGPYEKASPQVADLDGDGVPEVLVYNKIYNAVTGELLLELETMGTAFLGCNVNASGGEYNRDKYVAFPYIYDMDGDGIYDIVCGGKIYKISKTGNAFNYSVISAPGVADGYTGVADVTGDGIADVVVVNRAGTSQTSNIIITVWNPGFKSLAANGQIVNNGIANPVVITQRSIPYTNSSINDWGTNSYVYIGDIDGREQTVNGKTYRLPEIAVLAGRINPSPATFPVHPNLSDVNFNFPSTLNDGSVAGALFALTYDVEAGDLKASFLMEHYDRSLNTGFTLFDFDNDGVQEICYRDEKTLRIIKPTKPYVSISDNDPSVILFKEQCNSDTGFEYPVIADVDNDASAEICVLGTFNSAENVYEAFLFVLGNGSGDKFAPARKVWNQFMYDPFKIDDNLQTPIRPAIDRLQSSFNYRLVVRDENGDTVRVIDQYNPYNATINQAPYHNAINEGDRQLPIYNPIVFLTQAAIGWHNEDAPKLVFEDNKYYIEITVSNGEHARTDIATATPIAIYKNNKVTAANLIDKSPLSAWTNVATGTNISAPIKSGEKVRIRRLIGSAASLWDGIYIVRLGDDSGGTPWVWRWGLNSDRSGVPDDAKGIGIARRAYRDCAWDDQWVRVSRFLIYPDDDFATVQHYSTTMIDILANDVLLPPCDTITLTPDKLITPAGAGVLKGDFGEIRIVNNKLLYTAPSPSLHTGVVNISYVLEYPQENEYHRAEIYIYLVESCTETFSACSGQPYQVCLKENPAGVKFKWYDMNYASLGSTAPLIENPTANVSYYVKPDFSGVTTGNPWLVLKDKDFPTTKITVNVHSSAGDDTLRWTGVDDSDWFNPGNWVKVVNGKHLLTDEIPNSPCINVVLGEGSIYYPELTGDVNCSHIHLEDKTVFTGLQHLDYATASLEYQPETSEKGRFTMWSAPLKNMYTGDYHFPKEDTGLPHWGLVYMNFFQAANPDYAGSVAEEKAFTATFGDMDTQLPLGKAFNINILPNVEGKRFTFPKTFDRYTASNGTTQTGVLDRTNAARFITDGVMQANGTLELPVDDQYSLIQIVNPFAAYLKVNEFLALPANSAKLENAYKLWDGKLESGFVTLLTEGNSLRMVIADADKIPAETETLVEPFHSFFVMKKQGASFSKLTIKPEMLTTVAPTSKLVLRSAPAADKGVLRITARQQSNSNATVLRRQSGAVPAYDADEDSRKVFIDDVPLLVYSITDGGDALSINQSDDFTHNVRLGLRIRNLSQPVTLTFSEVQNFGRRVWLVDKETGRETDLLTQPEYTFTAKAGSTASELNDRFTLRFGEPTAADAVESGVRVYAAEGQIHIRALDGVLTGVEVFNVSGALVWRSNGGTAETSVAVAPDQVYLVRTAVNGKPCETKKIMVFN